MDSASSGATRWVHEERADAAAVPRRPPRSPSTCAGAARVTARRTSREGPGWPAPGSWIALQLRIPDRGRSVRPQPEADGRDQEPAPIGALEAAVAIAEPHSAPLHTTAAPVSRSMHSTRVTASDTSCPYAPTFWIGVAPTQPGMPDRHSRPAQPRWTQRSTSASQLAGGGRDQHRAVGDDHGLRPGCRRAPRAPGTPRRRSRGCCRRPARTGAAPVREPTRSRQAPRRARARGT